MLAIVVTLHFHIDQLSTKRTKNLVNKYDHFLDNSVHERRWRIIGLTNSYNTRDIYVNENKVN
jgi:hypothetical protein